MKHIEVVAAIIRHGGKILCLQRGENKLKYISRKYEFPGGKIEHGEKEEEALRREILEELKMEIQVEEKLMTVRHQYPDFHITMHGFICSCLDPHFTLIEHIDAKWLKPTELGRLDWAAADIPFLKPLLNY
jgi:8-oxo-dGTP diphosphatase